jgi:hypothetical protein
MRLEIRLAECRGCPRPDLEVKQPGWPEAQRFIRALPSDTAQLRLADYLGVYYLEPLEVHYTVKSGARGLTLQIGAGVQSSQLLHLTPVGRDVFRARSDDPEQFDLYALGWVSIKFLRGAGGDVNAMRFTMDRVRDLRLAKVR